MREVVDWTRRRRVHGVYGDRDRGQLSYVVFEFVGSRVLG